MRRNKINTPVDYKKLLENTINIYKTYTKDILEKKKIEISIKKLRDIIEKDKNNLDN